MNNWYMLTMIGADKSGIVAAVTQLLFSHDMNLGEASMLRLGGNFTIMMMVSSPASADDVRAKLKPVTEEMGLCLHVDLMQGGLHQHIAPNLMVRVNGADRAGIVARVTGVLAETGFNILDLESDVAGSKEQPVYIMQIAGVAATPLATLESALADLREEGIDVSVSDIETLVG